MRFDGMMFGAAVALLTHKNFIPDAKWSKTVGNIGMLAAAALFYMSYTDYLGSGQLYLWGFTLVNACAAIMIAAVVWYPSKILDVFFTFKPLCWLGTVSYGVYLWHWPVFRFFANIELKFWAKAVLEIGVSLGIAVLSFYLMERYFLKLKRHFR